MWKSISWSMLLAILSAPLGQSDAACGQKPKPAARVAAKEVTDREEATKDDSENLETSPKEANKKENEGLDEQTQKLLRQTVDFYKKYQSFSVDHEYAMHVQAEGMDNRMESQFSTVVEQPNRLALRMKDGLQGFNLVSDGKSMTMHMPMMKTYTVSDSPETFDKLLEDPLMMGFMGGSGMMLFHFLAADPFERIMEGVTASRYLGSEQVGETPAHHLGFTQDSVDWELWVAAKDPPVVLKVSIDMSKTIAQQGFGDEQFKSMKFTLEETYTKWKFDVEPEATTFVFTPPEGAKKVDSFFGALDDSDELSELLGEPAPDFELKLLDEGDFRLADHRGKNIVVLDFWATWCGPCVQELPLVVEVAGEFQDKGVVFCAVNQQEKPKTIQEFLEDKELDLTVSLDSDGSVGNAYGVSGIPTLVLIDKKGTVQSVHVGFAPDIKDQLTEELNALIAGRNLAEEAIAARDEKPSETLESQGLELAWAVKGRYSGVAVSPDGQAIFSLKTDGTCDVLDRDGENRRSFELGSDVGTLRIARLTDSKQGDLLAFRGWGSSVVAVRGDGTALWTHSYGQGVDDVWAVDLDDDGRDEVIVGYNGATGLHVLDFDGKPRWKYTEIGNVWHVTAGDVTGDGKVEVVTTSASGNVHLFDAEGKEIKTLETEAYCNMVRLARFKEADAAATILLIGSEDGAEKMIAIDSEGTERWSLEFPDGVDHADSLAVASKRPWGAVGLRGGLVCVVDLLKGEIIATATGQGRSPEVGWAGNDESPLLLVATGRELKAFHVEVTDD